MVGFGSLAADGNLDMLYVQSSQQRQGVASTLLAALENKTLALKLSHITELQR